MFHKAISLTLLLVLLAHATLNAIADEPTKSTSESKSKSTFECSKCRSIANRLKKKTGVEFVYRENDIAKCTWKLDYQLAEARDRDDLLKFLRICEKEFGRYPVEFIRKSGLKQVALVKELAIKDEKVEGKPLVRQAVPDYHKETLFYQFNVKSTREYPRRMIHHEYYHMIEEQFNGNAYFKDPKWNALNEKGFKYGKGGKYARTGDYSLFTHPAPGFPTKYAMSGLEEDKAVIWSILFVPENYRRVEPWLKDDPILQSKFDFLKSFAAGVCPDMKNKDYWKSFGIKPASKKPAAKHSPTSSNSSPTKS